MSITVQTKVRQKEVIPVISPDRDVPETPETSAFSPSPDEINPASTLSLDHRYASAAGGQPADAPTDARESSAEERTNVPFDDVSRETLLAGTSCTKLYRMFRADGLNRRESRYNALYLVCSNRYEQSASDVKKKYRSVHAHPHKWSRDKSKTHRRNFWWFSLRALEALPAAAKPFGTVGRAVGKVGRIPHHLDNSLRAFRTLFRVLGKAVLPAAAVLSVLLAGSFIASHTAPSYALGVYVDGEYVGNTQNIADITAIKRQYEASLGDAYGTPVILQCHITYAPQPLDESRRILPGDTSIFNAYMETYTSHGYGLYVDNKLAAVTEVARFANDAVKDYKTKLKLNYMRYYQTDVPDDFVFHNNITVIDGKYPKSYFLSENELRSLFGLAPKGESGTEDGEDFSYSQKLDYSGVESTSNDPESDYAATFLNSSLETDVSVDVLLVREEQQIEVKAYETEYEYDDTRYEGVRRTLREGRDGRTRRRYRVTYSEDRIVSRELIDEEVLSEAQNRHVCIGTKPLPEGLRSALPTGTYIYPYDGLITSVFGWRILGNSNDFHQGLDICGPRGGIIVAADGGEVIEAGVSRGYGNYVKIRHNETVVTRYAHCDSILVSVGDYVAQGDAIATLGDTGNATGVHVHFEVISDGATVDPLPYMSGALSYYLLD